MFSLVLSFLIRQLPGILATLALSFFVLQPFERASGINEGRAIERTASLGKSVEILRERNVTDEEVRNMDDATLCAALGGLLQPDGKCV